jgi:hypothetical protein
MSLFQVALHLDDWRLLETLVDLKRDRDPVSFRDMEGKTLFQSALKKKAVACVHFLAAVSDIFAPVDLVTQNLFSMFSERGKNFRRVG